MTIRIAAICASAAFLATSASAATITQWNFNSTVPDANVGTGSTTASLGTGSASLIGGATATFASGDSEGGSSDPASGDDSAWNLTTWPSQGTASGTRGARFALSTVGFQNIVVSWDQRNSNTAPNALQLQYTLNGSTFTSAGLANNGIVTVNAGTTWFNGQSVDLSSIAGAANNANFAILLVAVFAPSTSAYAASNSGSSFGTSGTIRLDMVTISGDAITVIPLPTSAGLATLALGAITARRRR